MGPDCISIVLLESIVRFVKNSLSSPPSSGPLWRERPTYQAGRRDPAPYQDGTKDFT